MKPPYLLFDIGGTKTRLSVSLDGKSIEPPVIVPTQEKFSDEMKHLKEISSELMDHKPTAAIGGMAGSLSKSKDTLIVSPNLPDWSGKNIKESLEKIFGIQTLLENDAAMAGLGEAKYGAGKDHKIIAYITISTGVNGVKIVDGKIDSNIFGFEIGHQIINFDASHDFTNYGRGTLEDYIGGRSLQLRHGDQIWHEQDKALWEDISYHASLGIYNTILHWSPEIVIIGGTLGLSLDLKIIEQHLGNLLINFESLPKLTHSELGDLAGLWGALAFVA